MRRASWAWWTPETHLPWLKGLLCLAGMALLIKLLWLLGSTADPGLPTVWYEQATQCTEPDVVDSYRREGLARVLNSAPQAPLDCWQAVTLPHRQAATAVGFSRDDGPLSRTWTRVRYRVPPDWPRHEQLMIHVPRVGGAAWQLRVDGINRADDLDDWRMTWNHPVVVRLQPAEFRPGQVLTIDLGIVNVPQAGQAVAGMAMGRATALNWQAAWRAYLQLSMPQACSMVLLLLGGFFFAFWCARRHEQTYLLLALSSLAWSVCNLQYVLPRPDDPALERWYESIVHLAITWFMWLIYQFAFQLLPPGHRRASWAEWALPVYVLAMSAAALPVWGLSADLGLLFQLVNAGVALGITASIGLLAVRTRGIELRVLGIALAMALAAGAHDLALMAQLVNPAHIYLLPYSGLLVFGSCLFAVQRRYLLAIEAHEALSASLSSQLSEREEELGRNHQRLRELERAQTLADERQRLMRDMHDGLGSALTSSLALAERGEMPQEALATLLRECVDDLRVVIDSLEPIHHDLVALLANLRFRLGRRIESAGIELTWEMQDLPELSWMGPPEALHVMRMVQEVLSNVVKHAQARCVHLSVRQVRDQVELRIVDDGRGFDLASGAAKGRGLPFMKQRAAQVGALLRIQSTMGQGTAVSLCLPVVKLAA